MKKLIIAMLALMLLLTSCSALESTMPTGSQSTSSSDIDVTTPTPTPPEDNQPSGNLPGGDTSGDNQPDGNQPGGDTSGDNQPDGNLPGGDTSGDNQPDGNLPGGDTSGDNQPDGNLPGGDTSGDNQPDGNLPGGDTSGNNQPEDNTPTQNPTEHKHSYQTTVTPATCVEAEYTTYTCECGHSYVISSPKAPLGHTEKTIAGKAATCTEAGLTEGVECSVCGETLETPTPIAPKGHSYQTTVAQPTCSAAGYTTYTCSTCGDSYTANTVSALGHSYQSATTQPTCVEAGYTTYTCSTCGDSYTANTVSALGHSYQSATTQPTCVETGYTTYTCATCGDSYTANTVSALGHSYQSATTQPTCVEAGYTTYTCATCGDSYTANTVSALGHSWQAATTEAPKTCKTCGATEGEKLPADNTGSGTDSGSSSTTYETLYVNYINVGQGDSILIKVGNCDILIDGGTSGQGSTVVDYLNSKNVDDIELLINSHPDEDHYGGLKNVLTNFKVENFWGSSYAKSTSTYTTFKSAISAEGLSFKTPSVGTTYTYENLTLTVLYNGAGASSSNDSSLVISLQYGNFRFLFTGDISSTIEKKLVSSSSASLRCDVLKVPHHGSAGASSASFLSATGASYGVICVGSNSYGHPTSTALNNLSSAGISVYRTDQNGNVVFSTNGASLTLPGGSTVGGDSSSGGSSSGGSSSGGSSTTSYYIGNTESKVYHLPSCSNLPSASKQVILYSTAGYTPCGRCLNGSQSGSYIANATTKVYHVSSCSYLPDASNRVVITNTTGYTPCGHCITSSSTKYIANKESLVYHLPTCSYLPAASKQVVIYNTAGYTPCGHCLKK